MQPATARALRCAFCITSTSAPAQPQVTQTLDAATGQDGELKRNYSNSRSSAHRRGDARERGCCSDCFQSELELQLAFCRAMSVFRVQWILTTFPMSGEYKRILCWGASHRISWHCFPRTRRRTAKMRKSSRGIVPRSRTASTSRWKIMCARRRDALVHLAIASKGTGRPNESWLVHYSGRVSWRGSRVLGVPFVF